MRQKTRTIAAIAADSNGIVASTALTGGTPLTLLATTFNPPRRILFTASAALTGTLTLVGTDRWGNPISEAVSVPGATPVPTQYVYATLTSITPSDNDADTLEVGWDTEVISAPVVLDHFRNPFNVSVAGEVIVGAANWTIQHTFDDLQLPDRARDVPSPAEGSGEWFPHASLAGETTSGDGNYAFPVEAVRLVVTAGTVKMTVTQAGPRG